RRRVNGGGAGEKEVSDGPAPAPKRVAVLGAGVAGIAAALEAGRRGHHVTLFEAASRIGGQFVLAANIPGKEDYGLSLECFEAQLAECGVEIKTGIVVDAERLKRSDFDEVIVSTGISPRLIDIPGGDDPRVVGYTKVLDGTVKAGERVVIIGGGGIGHDVALFLAMESNGRRQTR